MKSEIDYIIADITLSQKDYIHQTAKILYEGFKEHWSDSWKDINSAIKEVEDSISEEKISRIAIKDNTEVIGWIGGLSTYNGNVWELHPLVVKQKYQNQGIGRALVLDLEEIIKSKGAYTILLGTDDEDFMTSLSGVNLYDNLWEKVKDIKNINHHPYEFYQKVGYTIVGVVPDANGLGKPDIVMAKKLYG